jgi:hypothetical protein
MLAINIISKLGFMSSNIINKQFILSNMIIPANLYVKLYNSIEN